MTTLRRFGGRIAVGVALLALTACSHFLEDDVEKKPEAQAGSLHALTYETLEGGTHSFAEDAGKVLLVVNTASECGYTPQYEGLEELHRAYAPRGFAVVGFPCDDFGGQEPGDAAAIRQFCTQRFGVTFPLAAKVRVKTGEGQSPVFAFLSAATGKLPGWNFGKYLVGKDGRAVAFYPSNVAPDDPALRSAIETELAR